MAFQRACQRPDREGLQPTPSARQSPTLGGDSPANKMESVSRAKATVSKLRTCAQGNHFLNAEGAEVRKVSTSLRAFAKTSASSALRSSLRSHILSFDTTSKSTGSTLRFQACCTTTRSLSLPVLTSCSKDPTQRLDSRICGERLCCCDRRSLRTSPLLTRGLLTHSRLPTSGNPCNRARRAHRRLTGPARSRARCA
ncbi:MAG: hypothetical protein QOH71_1627 [Blastocatellia bacterium]|nr:hypothetical protein [Blastocatellia bacterium]